MLEVRCPSKRVEYQVLLAKKESNVGLDYSRSMRLFLLEGPLKLA
jgi:hypothetical protein